MRGAITFIPFELYQSEETESDKNTDETKFILRSIQIFQAIDKAQLMITLTCIS